MDPTRISTGNPTLDIQLTEGSLQTQIMFDISRREAVGRNTVENRTFELTGDLGGGRAFRTIIKEKNHSQVLRIAER